jgi:hypothetical protein
MIPLTGLILPYVVTVPRQDLELQRHAMVFFMFIELK